jgi:hypothetical protein
MMKLFGVLGLIAFVIVLIALGPLVTIWAWNTLFPAVVIDYNFYTWLSVVILGTFFKANVSVKKKD